MYFEKFTAQKWKIGTDLMGDIVFLSRYLIPANSF